MADEVGPRRIERESGEESCSADLYDQRKYGPVGGPRKSLRRGVRGSLRRGVPGVPLYRDFGHPRVGLIMNAGVVLLWSSGAAPGDA